MIAINATTQAVSRLTPPWKAVVVAGGYLHGISDVGLEQLNGPLEDTANPLFRTGKLNLRPGAVCAVHPAHMLVSADGPLDLHAVGDEDGEELTIDYVVPVQASTQKRQRRISLGRGVKASTWSFELTHPEGENPQWSISAMAVDVPAIKLPRN